MNIILHLAGAFIQRKITVIVIVGHRIRRKVSRICHLNSDKSKNK